MEFAFVGSSTETEWRKWHGINVEVDDTGGVQLARERFPTYVTPMPIMGKMPRAFTAIDIDLDAYGSLYVLSGVGNLFRYDRERERVHHLPYPRLDEEEFGDPTALHVSGGLLYVAYSRNGSESGSKPDTGSVHAVDLRDFQTKWINKNAAEERRLERPRRIVEDVRTQTVYALDGGTGDGERLGVVVSVDTDGTITPVVEGLRRAEDIAVDRTGALYVLAYDTPVDGDEPIPVVWRFDADDLHESEDPMSPSSRNRLLEVRINDPVRIEIVDEEELLLGVGPDTSNEAVLFRYLRRQTSESETPSFSVERLTSFRRSSHRLLLARGRTKGRVEGLYVIDSDQGRIHFLPETRQNRRKKRTIEDEQQLQTGYTAQLVKRFDSGVAETHWHRVKLGLDRLDPNTQVRLSYYATDGPIPIGDIDEIRGIGSVYAGQLRDADVEDVSELVRRSPEEIADATTAGSNRTRRWDDQAWNRFEEWWRKHSHGSSEPNPRDALLDAAVGRYLWVGLELTGSEFTSPRLNSFRAYFPKRSYLRYLPAIYREDERSAAFLERFLSVFETMFVDIEEGIEGITRILDAGGAPAPYLTWLQRWMAVETDETWSEAARREFLSNAPALFKARGTRSGLIELLRIYLEVDDPRPSDDETRSRVSTHSHVDGTSTGKTTKTGSTEPTYDATVGPYLLEHLDLDGIDDPNTRGAYERFMDCPQCFLVLLGITVDDEQTRTVQRIIEAERPVHTTGRAVKLRPLTQLGSHTYLGLNTVLSRREFVLDRTELGVGSVLLERGGDHQTDT